ncbi:pyruvate kinase [Dichotomicrobium thermohalophilum]|uniref:Pyruvate kinase n=1 Tax=Dichotomicrobium thermohalophilum TaxID=933063 RepID=A0A397QEK3_9HYPH|nr:pyruvate kinase [Dichotomicrobium thermohalophilum]RIA56701.1 pyruvate kinase [Dichotomicrobium thermohalophilum]
MAARRVKIVATLGPASFSPETIGRLIAAGTDTFRINMSHTSHDAATAAVQAIRAAEARAERPIGILVDLQGPKLRIGDFADGAVDVEHGATFRFDKSRAPGTAERVHLPHPEIFTSVAPGDRLLLDDGKLRLDVTQISADAITAQVVIGGSLSGRKGISLPDTELPVGALTAKDRADLDFMLEQDVDWLALSFVQREDDIAEAAKLARGRAAIMAKIEKPAAVHRIDRILERADALMVARGDLGVEMPLQQVPGLQKSLTRAARRAGKPIVIATQMLESMIDAPAPTRAEVSDVATAVFEGADAVMLSAESAVGKYPVEAVEAMADIAAEVERDPLYDSIIHAPELGPDENAPGAISAAACSIAKSLNLALIICYTATGATALRAVRHRPSTPVLALTPVPETARRLALAWGLRCVLTDDPSDLDDMVERACGIAREWGFAEPGQRVIIAAGVPLGTPGATNMLRVAFIEPASRSRP